MLSWTQGACFLFLWIPFSSSHMRLVGFFHFGRGRKEEKLKKQRQSVPPASKSSSWIPMSMRKVLLIKKKLWKGYWVAGNHFCLSLQPAWNTAFSSASMRTFVKIVNCPFHQFHYTRAGMAGTRTDQSWVLGTLYRPFTHVTVTHISCHLF